MSPEPPVYLPREKALDLALWLNFQHRLKNDHFGVVRGNNGLYIVVPTDHPTFDSEPFIKLPKSYKKMDYDHVKYIAIDEDPLSFWEEIRGMFSSCDGELLRFILKYHVPLNRFIRFELAARGYDTSGKWCGFEKAKTIWLK